MNLTSFSDTGTVHIQSERKYVGGGGRVGRAVWWCACRLKSSVSRVLSGVSEAFSKGALTLPVTEVIDVDSRVKVLHNASIKKHKTPSPSVSPSLLHAYLSSLCALLHPYRKYSWL